jgi:hypothetical protein
VTAPANAEDLRPFLDSPDLNVQLYALWRLEHLLCGHSRHLTDSTTVEMTRLAVENPGEFRHERSACGCAVIRDGYWPPREFLKHSAKRRSASATSRAKTSEPL